MNLILLATTVTKKLDHNKQTIIYGESFTLLHDGYEEAEADSAALDNAAIIDEEAAKLDADVIEN